MAASEGSTLLTPATRAALHRGVVLPAHPLALSAERKLDVRHQRALTRYYAAAGAGGIAVGVHTTQFAIRDPAHGLLRPVLELAAETLREHERRSGCALIRIAGVCGERHQALREAALARDLGYEIALLSLAALPDRGEDALIEHCSAVGAVLPLFGFYLQPAVGGRVLSRAFWRRFAGLPSAVAIKIAPFDRYRTLEVLRAVEESGRADEIALYTGNDDHIVLDLLSTPRMVGGLLGHWAVWTRRAVELLEELRAHIRGTGPVPRELLVRASEITDANAAIFDAANGFAGCIPGVHEVLRRQGLLAVSHCLDPAAGLSPGQAAEIDRVCAAYPHLGDDEFVARHLEEWLRP